MRVALALALVVTALVYARQVQIGPWIYEDTNAVSANASVLGRRPIAVDRARWVSALSHRLVWTAVGDRVAVHHAVNVALHLGNGVLVYAVAGALVAPPAAAVAAALFLLHPLQTEAVAYAASRSELLATCFALVACWLSLTTGGVGRQVAIWTCVALAIGAKESAIVVVPLLALLDYVRGRRLRPWRYGVLLVPIALVTVSVMKLDFLSRSELGWAAYAATQATAVWRYLALVVVPIGFGVDHDFDVVPWAVRWLALYGLASVTLLAVIASVDIVDGDTDGVGRLWDLIAGARVATFGALWLLLALAPRFVMRIPETLNEHQTYLPFIGVWIVLGALVHAFVRKGSPDGLSAAR